MTEYYETDEDPDTLAVLYRGDIEVRLPSAFVGCGENSYWNIFVLL